MFVEVQLGAERRGRTEVQGGDSYMHVQGICAYQNSEGNLVLTLRRKCIDKVFLNLQNSNVKNIIGLDRQFRALRTSRDCEIECDCKEAGCFA